MNKELQEIIAHFERLEGAATQTVLATVVDVKGSSYRLPGARMLIGENGASLGTVSGGCLEADVVERARRVLRTGAPEVFTYDTTTQEESVFSLNMGCRGIVRILLERPSANLIDFFRALRVSRAGGLLATLINSGAAEIPAGNRLLMNGENVLTSDFSPERQAALLPACLSCLREKQSKRLINDAGEFFLEFISPPVSLVIFGAGFDAVPLAEIARQMGWRITIVDHRAAFASEERFPQADKIIIARPENVGESVSIDENTVAVVMTHNYEHDKQILRFLLNSAARYVGALGPKKRADNILRECLDAGESFSAERLKKLHAPVGLDIGADNPEAIALSIVAEIKSVLANRAGGFLRERKGSIYDRHAAG